MIDRNMLLKLMGALPDDTILKALQAQGIHIKEPVDHLAGMDPNNMVQGWSGINIARGPDNRPRMADKNYLIEKLALNEGQEMPHDSSPGGFTRPF